MQKHVINDVLVVIFATALLVALSITALHRSEQAQLSRISQTACQGANCNILGPVPWR